MERRSRRGRHRHDRDRRFRSSRNSANQAIAAGATATAATLNAARENRFWEKQAAAYEETLGGLLYRQAKRQDGLRTYRLPEDDEHQLGDFFAEYEPPGWFEAQGRLLAYASDEVREAFEATRRTDLEVWGLYKQ